MINENRVYQMTQLAMYEKNEGPADERIGSYYATDYIGGQLLASVFAATILYGILFAVYAVCHFDELLLLVYGDELRAFLMTALLRYVLLLVVFCAATLVIYLHRYRRAMKGLRLYSKALDTLASEAGSQEEKERYR